MEKNKWVLVISISFFSFSMQEQTNPVPELTITGITISIIDPELQPKPVTKEPYFQPRKPEARRLYELKREKRTFDLLALTKEKEIAESLAKQK